MSKFCPYCGAGIDDATLFCPACGGKIEAAPAPAAPAPAAEPYQQPAYQQPVYQQPTYQEPYQQPAYQQPAYQAPQYEPQPKKKSPVGLIIGLAAGLTALVAVFLFFLLRAPYGSALKNYLNAQYLYEPKSGEDLMPEEAWTDYYEWCDSDVSDCEDEFDYYHDDYIDYLEDYYGDDFKFKYKVDDARRLSDSRVRDIADELESYYYIDSRDVTQAYALTVTCTIEGDYDWDTETVELVAVKIDGQWYIMEDEEFFFW